MGEELTMIEFEDRVIYRDELQSLLKVSSETIRRWKNEKRLPEPDVALTRKTVGWKRSTLELAGIRLP
jgi:predicted DNA-binding transcriptional regulator AlpA